MIICRQKAVIFGFLIIGCLLVNGIGHAATIQAHSCSQADVQSAINSSSAGGTVIIPSGTCSWTKSVVVNKDITVQGAGSGAGGTKLTRTSGQFLSSTGNTRITGIHFAASGNANNYIQIKGVGGWRIDNCRIENTTTNTRVGVYVRFNSTDGQPKGLIDNNIFNNCRIYIQSALTKAYNTLMDEPTLLGTANTVYIEDNKMDRTRYASVGGAGNWVDSQYGGSYVARFNTLIDGHLEVHSSDRGPSRAGRYWEIYNNKLSHPAKNWDRAIFIRGGTGVIFNNEITDAGFARNNIDLDNHAKRDGACNGTNAADGNQGSGSNAGWPCRDQIGRATDEFLWKSGGAIPGQASEPAYIWNNAGFKNTQVYSGDGAYIVQSRDYYEDDDSHMESGTWANRPGTCAKGDGYWATDRGEWNSNSSGNDGQLYKCNNSNTWVLYYTPYPYPHPLRGELPGQTSGMPSITNPLSGSTLSGSSKTFSWTANDASVNQWWLTIGTSLGAKDLYDSGSLGTTTSDTVSGLPTNGSTVHVRLWYVEGGSWKFTDATYTAFTDGGGTPPPVPNNLRFSLAF